MSIKGFSFGTTVKSVVESSPEKYPGKMIITLKPEGGIMSRRMIEFNDLAYTTMMLNREVVASGDDLPVTYSNETISTAITDNGMRFLFVNNGEFDTERFPVGRTSYSFANKALYNALIKDFNLDPTTESDLEIIAYTGDAVPKEYAEQGTFYLIKEVPAISMLHTNDNEHKVDGVPVSVNTGENEMVTVQ